MRWAKNEPELWLIPQVRPLSGARGVNKNPRGKPILLASPALIARPN